MHQGTRISGARLVRGVLWLAVGLLWVLQGLGILHGTAITGHLHWAVVGAAAGMEVAGLIGLGRGIQGKLPPGGPQ